jgi:hypothetical protein
MKYGAIESLQYKWQHETNFIICQNNNFLDIIIHHPDLIKNTTFHRLESISIFR